MQIQCVKTVEDLQGNQPSNLGGVSGAGSSAMTKDYFVANPVFYYCYRIFPFERGHGIFVANSIRRFLLYEIPTIAITSVLIHSRNPSAASISVPAAESAESETGSEPLKGGQGTSLADEGKRKSKSNKALEKTSKLELNSTSLSQAGFRATDAGQKQSTKLAASAVKKKKVTKKALKEQAAELFSYSSDHFPVPISENLETEEVSSMTEFTTIPFVRESFLEILLNLKACVFENTFAFDEPPEERSSKILKGKLILNASQESLDDPTEISKEQELYFQKNFTTPVEELDGFAGSSFGNLPGRRVRQYKIWAKDLLLPPGLKVKNPNHVLATLVAPKTNCELELSFEKIFQLDLTTLSMKTGRPPHRAEEKRRNVPIDGTLFPIKKVNFALSYTKFQKEIITFEIWTNGSVNPRDAIFQSVEKILSLFQNLRQEKVKEIDAFAETALDEFEQEEPEKLAADFDVTKLPPVEPISLAPPSPNDFGPGESQ